MAQLPKSLPRICVALGFPTAAQLSQAAEKEYRDGNNFLEFRLDYLKNPLEGIALIEHLRKSSPEVSVLATCRHTPGNGTIDQQLCALQAAGKAGAAAIDLEIESAAALPDSALNALREAAPLIVSYHNFESTPALQPVLRKLQRIAAAAYKIATTARKPSDNLRLIDLAREHQDVPLIALAMSDLGSVTRILSPSLGCLFTYAAPMEGDGTASGQIPAKLMRHLYRADKLTRHSLIYGIIADPVAHTKSPVIHNRAFQARRIDAAYLPFRVGPAQLGDWMTLALKLPVAGFSVTIPHKQRILRYLDVVEPLAKRIGAVNTVWRKAGKWRGANTDTKGVLVPLGRHLRLPHASILIAGYGGAARAAAFALLDAGAEITITGRNLKSAQSLAQAVKAQAITIDEAAARTFDALIHATPVGMSPNPNESLFKDTIPAGIVLDMVYNPHDTLLLQQARAQGCTVIHGIEMLLEQAACQFEIWTGESAPRAVMQKALE